MTTYAIYIVEVRTKAGTELTEKAQEKLADTFSDEEIEEKLANAAQEAIAKLPFADTLQVAVRSA